MSPVHVTDAIDENVNSGSNSNNVEVSASNISNRDEEENGYAHLCFVYMLQVVYIFVTITKSNPLLHRLANHTGRLKKNYRCLITYIRKTRTVIALK